MWVQLLSPKVVDLDGVARRYQAGDWVNVGRQTAMAWIAAKEARVVGPMTASIPKDSGLAVTVDSAMLRDGLAQFGLEKLPVTAGPLPAVPYERTIMWDVAVKARVELFTAGLGFLDRWSMAVPVWSYDELARDVGSEADRLRTEAVVHDLRVPVYDTRLMFVRRNAESELVMQAWEAERDGGDSRLAFLRAVYQVKPLILALPVTWLK